MKVQYKMDIDFGEEEYDWVLEIPEKIANTSIETNEVPAPGDEVEIWNILKHVDFTFDQDEWLIDIKPVWKVSSVIHADGTAVVTLV